MFSCPLERSSLLWFDPFHFESRDTDKYVTPALGRICTILSMPRGPRDCSEVSNIQTTRLQGTSHSPYGVRNRCGMLVPVTNLFVGSDIPRAAMMLAFRTAIGFSLSYTCNQCPSNGDGSHYLTLKALLPALLAVKAVAILDVGCFRAS